MIPFLESSWTWLQGVAPYVGAFAILAFAVAFVLAILSGAKLYEDERVMAILENGQKSNAREQGEGDIWSL
jgi:hypothetical protein